MLGRRTIALHVLSLIVPLACTGMAVAASDAPAPPPTGLHWTRAEGAEGCLDGTDLARRVAARMGHQVFVPPAAAELFVEGRVRARPEGGFAATLVLRQDDGTQVGARELSSDAEDCGELGDTAVLVLAVMLDPNAIAQSSSPEGQEASSEPSRPLQPEPSQPPPVEEPKGLRRNLLEGLARVATHTLPEPAAGGGVAYTRSFPRRLRLRIEAVSFNEQASTLDGSDPPRGATLQPLLAGAAICPTTWTWRELGSSLCAGVQVGAVIYRNLRLEEEADGTFLLVQGTLGMRLWWERDWIHLSVGASLVAAVKADGLQVLRTDGSVIPLVDINAMSADVDAALGVRF